MISRSLAISGLLLLASIATSSLLARKLGVEGRGELLEVTFWPAIIAASLSMSINDGLNITLARSRSHQEALKIQRAGLKANFWVTCASIGLSWPAIFFLNETNKFIQIQLLAIYSAIFIYTSNLNAVQRSLLQGLGRGRRLDTVRATQPLIYLLLIAWSPLLNIDSEVGEILVYTSIAAGIAAFVGRLSTRCTQAADVTAADALRIIKTSLRFHGANTLTYASSECDKAYVILLLSSQDAGLYAVALSASLIGPGLVSQGVGLVAARRFASESDEVKQISILKSLVRESLLILALVNGTGAVTAAWWVPKVFGDQFEGAVIPVILGLIAGAIKGVRVMIDRAGRATGQTRVGVISDLTSLMATTLLGLIGAAHYGLHGMQVGICLSQGLSLATAVWAFNRLCSATVVKGKQLC